MPRSKRTLSGCLESTFASGLLTFLLVQAVVIASVAANAITLIRRDMNTSINKWLVASDQWLVSNGQFPNGQLATASQTFCSVASRAAFNNVWALLFGSP